MLDTLRWIPTINPSRREPYRGLCLYGPTVIGIDGADVAAKVFGGWAELLAAGPATLSLHSGHWTVEDAGEEPPLPWIQQPSEHVAVEHRADRLSLLHLDRDHHVAVLRQLAEWCERVRRGGGRLAVLHIGV